MVDFSGCRTVREKLKLTGKLFTDKVSLSTHSANIHLLRAIHVEESMLKKSLTCNNFLSFKMILLRIIL